jgi:hypothetical protein
LVFHHTSEVIRAESLLKEAGFDVAVKGPPPDHRTGCDLVIEFSLFAQLKITVLLDDARIIPLETRTGDSLTGIVGALISGKYPIPTACALAARVNRTMGLLAKPSPASTIEELLRSLPEALKAVLP